MLIQLRPQCVISARHIQQVYIENATVKVRMGDGIVLPVPYSADHSVEDVYTRMLKLWLEALSERWTFKAL